MLYDVDAVETFQMNCCGISEINNLSEAKNAAEAMYSVLSNWNIARFAIFSQAGKTAKYGVNFAAFIEEHKLGTVMETEGWKTNPNSGRVLKVWIWTIDSQACRKWYAKEEREQDAIAEAANVLFYR